MAKVEILSNDYILIKAERDEEGKITCVSAESNGLFAGEYAGVLVNVLVSKGIKLGIKKDELIDAVSVAVEEVYDKMMEESENECPEG